MGLSTDGKDVIWKELTSMNKSRYRHIAVNLYDSLYVIGGFTDIPRHFSLSFQENDTTSCEIYNIYTKTWTIGPDLPCEMNYLFATTNTIKTFAIICGWTILDDKMKVLILDKDGEFKIFPGVCCVSTPFSSISPIP